MRIINIIPSIAEESSGPTYVVKGLCESLIAENHSLTLVALDWDPLSYELSYLKTFPLGLGPRRLGISPIMFSWLSESCANGMVDIMHNHGMWQMNSVYPAWAAKQGNVMLVYSPHGAFSKWAMKHGSIIKKIFWPLLQHPALKQAVCFHATSEAEYHDIRRLGFGQPVAIIPSGIDFTLQPNLQASEQKTLLFLGRIHIVKGLDILLSAWKEVQELFPSGRLVIAGSDDGYHGSSGYLDKIMLQAQLLGLQRVEFIGPLYGDPKLQIYRDANLFVLPSYTENFAVTVAEALSMGTPAIVSKGAPWSGLDKHGAGWWIDIGEAPLIACLKKAMACSDSELALMGQRGRSWMQSDFSWEKIGAQMAETYRWLLNRTLQVPDWVRLD